MQSYIDDGCRSINALIQYSQESFSTSPVYDIHAKLSQIRTFYDDISSHWHPVHGTMITNGWYVTRVLLLVRRVARTLKHIVIECQRKNKSFGELTGLLAGIYSECESIHVIEQDLTNHKLKELGQFEAKLRYEKILYEREIIMRRTDTKIDINILTVYLKHCIADNSFLYVNRLGDSLDEFLPNIGVIAAVENRENLKQCLNQIKIPLEFFLLEFQHDTRTPIEREHLRRQLGLDRNVSSHIDVNILHGLTKNDIGLREKSKRTYISDIFKCERYIVLLGDPGSGKSTFMRFVTRKTAVDLLSSIQTTENKPAPFARIPILIHLALFAKECAEKESLSILDYIEHEKNTLVPGAGEMLKGEIMKGNCILLFDGLDEVLTFESRWRVIHCVQSFIEQFSLTPAFISPFDSWDASLEHSLNSELPSETNGNQIIMTSRFIGYDAISLIGHGISHYIVPPLEREEKYKFIDHWYSHVLESVNKVLLSHNASGSFKAGASWMVYADELKQSIENSADLCAMTANLMLLSMICFQQYHSKSKQLPTLRIHLYQESVSSALRSYRLSKKTAMPEDIMHWILEDVAAYMHKEESSGVIDRFMLKRVCVHSMKTFYQKHKNPHIPKTHNLELEADKFVELIDQNTELLMARGQQIYGFIQMTFQEYFTCLRLVRTDADGENVHEVLETLLAHVRKPRFLLPVLLGLEWLSCNWTMAGFNAFCQQLVSHDAKHQNLPVGAMLMIEVCKNLDKKPEKSILYDAFDQFAHAHSKHEWFFHDPSIGEVFCLGLKVLPAAQSSEWLLFYLQKASSYEIVDLCLLIHQYIMSTPEFPEWLDADVCFLLSAYIQHDIDNNEYAVEQLLCLIADRKYERLWKIRANSRGLETLTKSIAVNQDQHHPLILAVIIALHGGLCGKEFNSLYIHRDSALSIFIAEYYDQISISHAAKVSLLLERCNIIIRENGNDSTSLTTLDAFTTLFCLKGIHDNNLCEEYKFHCGFYAAIRRLKNTLFYLHKRSGCALADFSIDEEYMEKFCACSNAVSKNVLGPIRQCTTNEENTSSISIDAKMLASEYMLAFMDATAVSLASLTLSIDQAQIEIDEKFSLFKWRMPFNIWTDVLCHFIGNCDLPYNVARVIPEWISFLSMIIHSGDHIRICHKDEKYLHKQFMQSIYDHSHIFYYTKDHPFFLISFIRPHRRALFCRFMTTNSLYASSSSSDDWAKKLAYVYLLTECLEDFPNKYDNNVCVFAFLILLLEPILRANRLQYFAWAYFLKVQSERIGTLKNFLRNVSSLFSWAPAIESFDNKSAIHVVEEQRQILAKTLLSYSGPQRDFELYTVCISLSHLATILFEDDNALHASLIKEIQCSALEISTPFYKVHTLNYCIDFNSRKFLESLPYLPYFLMAEQFYQHDTYFCDAIKRLNCLLHDSNNTEDRQAIGEALLPLKCFRKYILDNVDKFQRNNTSFMLSHALRMKSPVLHFHLENTDHFWSGNPSNSIVTCHTCLYLALLAIDAQSVLDEIEEQPIITLDLSSIKQKLKPSGYPPCLSKSQAHSITEYLENTFQSSKLDVILRALDRFDKANIDAYPYIRQWLQYRESPDLKLFAWHASILLPIENALQVSILVDIFQSDNDDLLKKARDNRFTISLSANPSLISNMTERMTQAFHCQTSPFPFSFLKRLVIDRIELLQQLFQAEQRLIYEKLEWDHTEYVLEGTQHEEQQIWGRLQRDPSILRQFVFSESLEPLAQAFVLEINAVLDGTNIGLLSTITDRCLYLLSLKESFEPFHDSMSNKLHMLQECTNMEERCRNFVWKIILASNQDSMKGRLVLHKCIRFYCNKIWLLTEYNINIIQKFTTESPESDLREIVTIIIDDLAIRTAYLNDESTKEYRNKLDELNDTDTIQYDQATKVEQIADYINKHQSTLLSIFVKDFIRSLNVANKGYVEQSRATIYGQIAEHLCKLSTRNFHMAIREIPQGELHFKELLYKIKCYEQLAYYGELTAQLLELLFEEDFSTEDNESIEHEIIPLIVSVANRPVLEQLYQKLMSKYSSQRLLAGRLLVKLALCDAISAQEACDKISTAIKDPFIQQQMKWFHADNKDCSGHSGLGQEMRQMLLRLSLAHQEPLTDSVQPCHEPTIILHYAKQTRDQVVCLFTTNQLVHVDESSYSNDLDNSDNDDGDTGEDDISD
ncbi:unnamed protein product [Rotaria socialis]|uniref:NACHT domain-containing protein n=1 Tax=Rotaria socialis TaxID=392032 RepID=A0A821DED7_9BILA|nr:unnamed protein product [Rotaria socialis]CAF3373000.1 unnamed protein product [Rotaria socialis]CAF3387570.1 unnamed protein product [Rotaria socialis]CAF4393229.1 unnamed protein product [Rotaria socialis]CAF4487126.1 unnamed protein product [Rotaria socialis]